MLIWSWTAALAAGPWVPGGGKSSLYLGVEGQRFTSLTAHGGDEVVDVEVGEGISTLTTSALITYGLASRAALEVAIPFHHGHASRPDHPLCTSLGLDACKATNILGVLEARAKGLLLDELSGHPLSLAVVGEVRFGALAAASRARLTGPGEGTLDFGPVVSVGRSGALAKGYYAGSLDVGWRYRVPQTNNYPQLVGDEVVPGSEFHSSVEMIFAPVQTVGIGPAVSGLLRPQGRDFQELVLDDMDRFSALRVGDLRGGVKLILKDKRHNAFVLSVARTVVAWNNPSDALSVGAGVNLVSLFDKKVAN